MSAVHRAETVWLKVTVVRSDKPHLANKQPSADIAQFNKQYTNSLTVKLTDKFHDRYSDHRQRNADPRRGFA